MKSQFKNTVVGSRRTSMEDANAVAVLQRTKQEDGSYIISLPVNTSDEVLTNLQSGETLTDRLIELNNRSMGLLQDLSTIVLCLSPVLTEDLNLNHIYRENFKTDKNLVVTNGTFEPGSISGNQVGYHLKQGIRTYKKPILVSVKDIKTPNLVSTNNVSVQVTANFEDEQPLWIDCTEEYLAGMDVNIPIDYVKEEGKPWSINFKFNMKSEETIIISDLIISHI